MKICLLLKNCCLCVILCYFSIDAFSQEEEVVPEPLKIPYRPRIAEISFNTLYDYNTTSNSQTFGEGASEYELDQQLKIRLGIPIIMTSKTLLGVQLKFDNHNFLLEQESSTPNELYDFIHETNFKSLGARFFYQRAISENKEISFLIGSEIKSDEIKWNSSTAKSYINVNYNIQKNENVKYGAGIVLSYTLETFQVYPLVFYKNHLTPKWTLDLALPKAAVIRRKFNDKTYLSLKTELKGWRYAVHNESLSNTSTLTLRKSDIITGLNFEREIHDWLWFGIDAGISKNIHHYLSKAGDSRRDAITKLDAKNAPFVEFSIFVVPPRKIYNK